MITCVLRVFFENMTISSRKNIRISVKKHKFALNEQNDAEDLADRGEEEAETASEKAEERKIRKNKADLILKFADKSKGRYEEKLFKSIDLVNDPDTFDDFLVLANEIFITAGKRVQEFSTRVLGKEDFLIGSSASNQISADLKKAVGEYKDDVESMGDWGIQEQEETKVDPEMIRQWKMTRKDIEKQKYEKSAGDWDFPQDAIQLSKRAALWLKAFNKNFSDMGKQIESKNLDVIEVFSSPINASILTEMRLVYAISTMLSKFSAVGVKNIRGPQDYHRVLNSKFLKKWFETGRRAFNKNFRIFVNAGFASSQMDKIKSKKAMRAPVDYKKMTAIMKGEESLEESIFNIQDIVEAVGGRYRVHMPSGDEDTNKPQEDFYDRLQRGGDLRTIFDCWADSKTDPSTGSPGLSRRTRVKFLADLRSAREERVLNMIAQMNKQVMDLTGIDCKDGGPGPGKFPVKPGGTPGGPTGPGGDPTGPGGPGGGEGSKFAVPVFKKHSGKEQEAGAPARSLASQLAKVFPDIPKSAISQILKDIAKQLKSQNINIQENKEVIAKILLEKARKSGRNDLFRQHKKALEDALQSKKPAAGKLKFVDNKAVVADNIWTGQRADGSRKEFNLSDYEGKTRKAQSKQARNAALCWAGDKEYCKEEDNSLFNRFKEVLKILDLHTSEGRQAALQTDEAYLGAYRFYKAMKLAYDGIKTDRLEDRTDRIEKILEPLNEVYGENEHAAGKEFRVWLGNMINIFDESGLTDSNRAMKSSRSARGVKEPKEKGYSPADLKMTAGTVNTRQSVGPQLKAAGIDINSPEGQKIQKRMLKVIRRFLNKNMQRIGKQDMKVISEKVLNEMKVRGIITESMPISVKPNITDETDQDMSQLIDMAYDFYPYSQQRLGFDKPAGIKLTSDSDNAANPLGKTAYYDPENYEIVLYVDNRHPKDLMRSLSHELVHHAQNCRGDFDKLTDTGPGYAQKDPHLRKMEAEAYLMGNGFLFRDWEDSIKENNKMLSETQIREMVREGLKKAIFEKKDKKPDGDGDGVPPWADKDDKDPKVQEEELDEASCGSHKRDVQEVELDERRRSADGSEAGSHGRGREGEDVANSARLEEADDVSEELDEATDVTEEDQEVTEELTVESRLRDKNDFLFEKLSKMWTK